MGYSATSLSQQHLQSVSSHGVQPLTWFLGVGVSCLEPLPYTKDTRLFRPDPDLSWPKGRYDMKTGLLGRGKRKQQQQDDALFVSPFPSSLPLLQEEFSPFTIPATSSLTWEIMLAAAAGGVRALTGSGRVHYILGS